MLWNSGPRSNSNNPVCGRNTSVPVRSAGSKSGVNWMRWKSASMRAASALTAVVLASPGAPSTSRWPSASRAISKRSVSAGWPITSPFSASRSAPKRCWRADGASPPEDALADASGSATYAGSVTMRLVDHKQAVKFVCRKCWVDAPRMGRPKENGAGSRAVSCPRRPGALLHHLFLVEDARGDEDQQLRLVVLVVLLAEQRAQHRHVAEERHLDGVDALGEFIHAAQHHGLAVVHQHRGIDLALVQLRDQAAARIGHERVDRVLGDLELHEDAVVGRNGRRHAQLQHRILELHGGRARDRRAARVLEGDVADF